jgi:hypothetical protein
MPIVRLAVRFRRFRIMSTDIHVRVFFVEPGPLILDQ